MHSSEEMIKYIKMIHTLDFLFIYCSRIYSNASYLVIIVALMNDPIRVETFVIFTYILNKQLTLNISRLARSPYMYLLFCLNYLDPLFKILYCCNLFYFLKIHLFTYFEI